MFHGSVGAKLDYIYSISNAGIAEPSFRWTTHAPRNAINAPSVEGQSFTMNSVLVPFARF